MKPRLEPCEHTPQDAIIWAHLNWRGGPRGGSLRWTLSLMQDRRDAEVMLQLTHYDHWERDYTRDRVRSVATAFRLVWRQL